MRKGDDGEKNGKRMMKIVATNVVASQPPERRPTATPTARANFVAKKINFPAGVVLQYLCQDKQGWAFRA